MHTCSWQPLTCKPGQNKPGYRGEVELRLGFSVQHSAALDHRQGSDVTGDWRRMEPDNEVHQVAHYSEDANTKAFSEYCEIP